MGILRLSHVDIAVPDLDLASAYYTQVIGMNAVPVDGADDADDADRRFFRCWDEQDHHSLAVRYDPRVGLDRISFKVEHEDDLDLLENAVTRHGYRVARVTKGDEVGQGESIRFETPSGHEMELVHDVDFVGSDLGSHNPAPTPYGPRRHRPAPHGPRPGDGRGGR